MATYTALQLRGSGSLGENLSGLKTFTFTNSGSTNNYFTIETIPNPSGFYVSGSSPKNTEGTWVVSASMGFVSSSYIASIVVPVGVSSLQFTPSSSVTGTSYYLKGTGNFSLTIA
jgi:hypothetical protein